MSEFFRFAEDVVYAPGMTCVYQQLFEGLFARPWKAYPFRKPELGFRVYSDPATVIGNLFQGEVEQSAGLFAEPERFRLENAGEEVRYDVLAIESRWLAYRETLFEGLDWDELAGRLERFHDRRIVFVDCRYPHYGYLQNIQVMRALSGQAVREQHAWQTARYRLLELLTRFPRFRYLAVDALSAYHGYRGACMDQPDHYTAGFRDEFRALLAGYSEDRQLANVRAFVAVEDAVTDRESEIELLEGMLESFGPGDIILKLLIRVAAEDPLCCPIEMLATWVAGVSGQITYRKNFTIGPDRIIRPVVSEIDGTTNKIVLKSLDDLVKIATLGRYKLTLSR